MICLRRQPCSTDPWSSLSVVDNESPITSVPRYISIWPCIVLGSQLSHSLATVLLHQARQSPKMFFFDNVWTPNTMSFTVDFTVNHPLCKRTKNCRSQIAHLITYFPCHQGEFIAKYRGGDNILALECIKFALTLDYPRT